MGCGSSTAATSTVLPSKSASRDGGSVLKSPASSSASYTQNNPKGRRRTLRDTGKENTYVKVGLTPSESQDMFNEFGLQKMTTDGMRDVSQRLKETQMRLDHSFPEVKEDEEYTIPETTGARRRSTVA